MTCKDCGKAIGYAEHKTSMDLLGVELCSRHTELIQQIIQDNQTPVEAIQLFYGLKDAGAHPMLEWWDGQKSVDIALSRVKLNIEIDTEFDRLTHQRALADLDDAMQSFRKGFTTLRIPSIAVKYYLKKTVENILEIAEGLKANIKVI